MASVTTTYKGDQETSCLTCASMQKNELKLIQGSQRILRSGLREEFDMNPVIFLQSVFWRINFSSAGKGMVDIANVRRWLLENEVGSPTLIVSCACNQKIVRRSCCAK